MHRVRSGFTLVELLVVITIIGLLIAMLIPAVNMVREKGRQAACMNNQHQLGLAILAYETSQTHLPGVMSMTTQSVQYSWVGAITPHIEHNDIDENIKKGNLNALTGVRISTVVCPDDPYTADPTSANAQNLLSYGINDQFFVDYRGKPYNTTLGIPFGVTTSTFSYPNYAFTFGAVTAAYTSDLKTRSNVPSGSFPRGQKTTTTQTVMIGERNWVDPAGAYVRATKWYDATNWPTWNSSATLGNYWCMLTFPYPTTTTAYPISPTIMASSHGATVARNATTATSVPGTVVVVTYFDGHAAIIPSDTQFPQ